MQRTLHQSLLALLLALQRALLFLRVLRLLLVFALLVHALAHRRVLRCCSQCRYSAGTRGSLAKSSVNPLSAPSLMRTRRRPPVWRSYSRRRGKSCAGFANTSRPSPHSTSRKGIGNSLCATLAR